MSAFGQSAPRTQAPPEALTPAPAPTEPQRPRWMYAVVVAAAVAAIVATYLLWPKPQQRPGAATAVGVRTFKAAVGSLVRTVRVSGVSSARNFAAMSIPVFVGPDSRSNLTILKLAKGGTLVQKGEVVALLDPQSLREHIDDTKDEVAQSELNIKKREAEQGVDWGSLQQTLKIARASLDKARLDDRAGEVRTEVERELLRLNLEEAQATYKQREADIAATRAGQQAELRILDISRQRNQNHFDRHAIDIVRFEIKAPMAGLVVMQPIFRSGEMAQIQEGDQVSPGQALMKVVDVTSMQVEATISQSQSNLLRIGQAATVGLDAFPELRLKGRIHSIGALATRGFRENYFVRSVPVRVTIEGADPRVIPDLSAWADIEFERADNVLVLPREAVHTENGQAVVFVKKAERFEKRNVALGLGNHVRVAVLEGLSAGEEVALSRP